MLEVAQSSPDKIHGKSPPSIPTVTSTASPRPQLGLTHHQHSQSLRLQDLEIGEELGKGFYGRVFKVTHKQTQQVFVLKELHKYDKQARVSFLKEVSLLRALSHHNVLRFVSVLANDSKLYLVTGL